MAFELDGQVVTSADIRQWLQSVAVNIPARNHWSYVRNYRVVEKIARAKAAGEFETLIDQAANRAGIKVRAPRKMGVLARLRVLPAANDDRF